MCIQQSHIKIKKIYIPQNLDDGIISYIKNNQGADYKYPVLEISKKIPEEKLLQILSYYYLKMQIIEININNKDTTKTLNGSPYKRQWVEIDSNGNISIKENEHKQNNPHRSPLPRADRLRQQKAVCRIANHAQRP